MRPGGFLLVTVIQVATFIAPLALARAGFMPGEAAWLAATAGWFVVGMPLSYAIADRLPRRKALAPAPAHERKPLRSVSNPTSA